MKQITDGDYKLFIALKEKAENIYNLSSAESIQNLEDDVDEPIKNCVAMLALLRCEPKFSCCGFDYKGQPIHKAHQYGNPYIILNKNSISDKISKLISKCSEWSCRERGREIIIELLITDYQGNPYWRSPSCIHFSEESVLAITQLENLLVKLEKHFLDSITLFDTNVYQKHFNQYWQYPYKKPWTIYKKDIV